MIYTSKPTQCCGCGVMFVPGEYEDRDYCPQCRIAQSLEAILAHLRGEY